MREIWANKKARRFLAFDLACAIPLATISGPWWMRVLFVAYGMLFLLITFGTGFFTGQAIVYSKTIDEMKEMRETVSEITAAHRKQIMELPPLPPEFTPPRHYH